MFNFAGRKNVKYIVINDRIKLNPAINNVNVFISNMLLNYTLFKCKYLSLSRKTGHLDLNIVKYPYATGSKIDTNGLELGAVLQDNYNYSPEHCAKLMMCEVRKAASKS